MTVGQLNAPWPLVDEDRHDDSANINARLYSENDHLMTACGEAQTYSVRSDAHCSDDTTEQRITEAYFLERFFRAVTVDDFVHFRVADRKMANESLKQEQKNRQVQSVSRMQEPEPKKKRGFRL